MLDGDDVSDTVFKMIETTIAENVYARLSGDEPDLWDFAGLREMYKGVLTQDGDFSEYENGKKATMLFAPSVPFTVYMSECGESKPVYKQVIELFRNIQHGCNFFRTNSITMLE